jgi:hypothetical protein
MDMNSRKRNTWIIVAVVAVALCCCAGLLAALAAWRLGVIPVTTTIGAGGGLVREKRTETLAFSEGDRLEVDNFAGSVTVLGGASDEAVVQMTLRGYRRVDLDDIEVKLNRNERTVRIETRNARKRNGVSVELEVTVPERADVDVHTGAGSVSVSGLDGAVEPFYGSGSVEAVEIAGDATVRTGSGSVQVRGMRGNVEARTGSGSVTLEGVRGEIRAHSGSGRVEAKDVQGGVELETNSGSVTYRGTPEGECRFTTKAGSVKIELPRGLGAELDLRTGNGSVSHEGDVSGVVEKDRILGQLGDGGECRITGHTNAGSVELRLW